MPVDPILAEFTIIPRNNVIIFIETYLDIIIRLKTATSAHLTLQLALLISQLT